MARSHARILLSAWQDQDFTSLTVDEQWAFFLVISQADLTHCGTIAYIPKRWARLASDCPVERITAAVEALEARGMFVVDRDTDELWVCSFVKHDGLLSQPNMVKAMRSAAANVLSPIIRAGIQRRYLDDLGNPSAKGSRKGSTKGSESLPETPSEGFAEPFTKGQGVGVGEGVGEDLQQSTQLSEGTHLRAVPDDPASRIKNAVAVYVREFEHAHDRPPTEVYKAVLARNLKKLAPDATDDELRAICICIGKLGKHPKNAELVLNDYRRDKKAGVA